jgi:hypothetical protein
MSTDQPANQTQIAARTKLKKRLADAVEGSRKERKAD